MPTTTYYVGSAFNLLCLGLAWRNPRRKHEARAPACLFCTSCWSPVPPLPTRLPASLPPAHACHLDTPAAGYGCGR